MILAEISFSTVTAIWAFVVLGLGAIVLFAPHFKMNVTTFKRIQLLYTVIAFAFCILMVYPGVPYWQTIVIMIPILATGASSILVNYGGRGKSN